VALTANAMREDIEKTGTAGCDMHLSKPVGKNRLMEVISKLDLKVEPSSTSDVSPDLAHSEVGMVIADFEPVEAHETQDRHSVNSEVLEQLRKDFGGDINPALTKFLQKLPSRLNAISNAVNDRDPDGLSKAAHKLKGTASTFGAEKLADLSQQLELMEKSGGIPDNVKLLSDINSEGESVQKAVRKILEG
jgi:HPt (histidine-containing phosphotransfer) domain-containing protein